MCGIALVPKSRVCEVLSHQKLRGLDSLGIIDFQSKEVFTSSKNLLMDYVSYIEDSIDVKSEEVCFLHHRKASVGAVSLDNSHPFIGNKFILAQNGTSKEFYEDFKDTYNKETDSETLLAVLEDTANTLEDCIDVLDNIESTLGIIFVIKGDKLLVYSDGTRGSYILVEKEEVGINKKGKLIIKSYVSSITNLKPDTVIEYCNPFYMIVDTTSLEILKEWSYYNIYNGEVWNTQRSHGGKIDKITQLTKKKTVKEKEVKKISNSGSNTNMLVYSKKNKNGSHGEGNSAMRNKQQEIITRITLATNLYLPTDLLGYHEIGDYLAEAGLVDSLSEKSIKDLGIAMYSILNSTVDYKTIYDIINEDIFNVHPIDDVIINPFLLIPNEYLIRGLIGNLKNAKINLIRHFRFIKHSLDNETVADYYEGLIYLKDDLYKHLGTKAYTSTEGTIGHQYSLETFLWLSFGKTPRRSQDTKYKFLMHDSLELASITGYIRAAHTFELTAGDLNIDKEVYNLLTQRI